MKNLKKWNKKIWWGLFIIPLTILISFLLLIIFIEVSTNFKNNFIKIINKNLNWKILLVTITISLLAYSFYIYYFIFKKRLNKINNNKVNDKNNKSMSPEIYNSIEKIGEIVMEIQLMTAELLEKTELNAIEKIKKSKLERTLNELINSLKDD